MFIVTATIRGTFNAFTYDCPMDFIKHTDLRFRMCDDPSLADCFAAYRENGWKVYIEDTDMVGFNHKCSKMCVPVFKTEIEAMFPGVPVDVEYDGKDFEILAQFPTYKHPELGDGNMQAIFKVRGADLGVTTITRFLTAGRGDEHDYDALTKMNYVYSDSGRKTALEWARARIDDAAKKAANAIMRVPVGFGDDDAAS